MMMMMTTCNAYCRMITVLKRYSYKNDNDAVQHQLEYDV